MARSCSLRCHAFISELLNASPYRLAYQPNARRPTPCLEPIRAFPDSSARRRRPSSVASGVVARSYSMRLQAFIIGPGNCKSISALVSIESPSTNVMFRANADPSMESSAGGATSRVEVFPDFAGQRVIPARIVIGTAHRHPSASSRHFVAGTHLSSRVRHSGDQRPRCSADPDMPPMSGTAARWAR